MRAASRGASQPTALGFPAGKDLWGELKGPWGVDHWMDRVRASVRPLLYLARAEHLTRQAEHVAFGAPRPPLDPSEA